jgi:hypothetical protein
MTTFYGTTKRYFVGIIIKMNVPECCSFFFKSEFHSGSNQKLVLYLFNSGYLRWFNDIDKSKEIIYKLSGGQESLEC